MHVYGDQRMNGGALLALMRWCWVGAPMGGTAVYGDA